MLSCATMQKRENLFTPYSSFIVDELVEFVLGFVIKFVVNILLFYNTLVGWSYECNCYLIKLKKKKLTTIIVIIKWNKIIGILSIKMFLSLLKIYSFVQFHWSIQVMHVKCDVCLEDKLMVFWGNDEENR